MSGTAYDLHGLRVFECSPEGLPLRADRDATEILSEAWRHQAGLIAIPAARLGADFFRLKTRIAGEILQRFVNYRMPVAIVGDISSQVEESTALRDFVAESNRGEQGWFVPDINELARRIDRPARCERELSA